jgi:hypothetical protein
MEDKQKNSPRPAPKSKKQGPSWVHAGLSHWLHETFISKTIHHHFWRVLMAGAQTVGLWCDPANVFLTSSFSFASSNFLLQGHIMSADGGAPIRLVSSPLVDTPGHTPIKDSSAVEKFK